MQRKKRTQKQSEGKKKIKTGMSYAQYRLYKKYSIQNLTTNLCTYVKESFSALL